MAKNDAFSWRQSHFYLSLLCKKNQEMNAIIRIVLTFLLWLPMCAIAQNTPSRVSDESLESLLQRLDNAVEHCEQYRKVREERISALMSALGTAKLWAERNTIISRLCDEYRTYNNDSAIVWLQRGIDAATAAGDMRSANRNRCRLARQYIKAG